MPNATPDVPHALRVLQEAAGQGYLLQAALGLLVVVYLLTMLGVLFSFKCKKSRFEEVEPKVTRSFSRQVKRQKSWTEGSAGFSPQAFEAGVRNGFVRKVYGVLATQLLFTVLVCGGMVQFSFDDLSLTSESSPSKFGEWVLVNGSWLIWVLFIPTIISICFIQGVKNSYPANYVGLFVFTFFESILIGYVCVVYTLVGLGLQILIALGITMVIFLALTIFTMVCPCDFNFLGPFLFASLILLILWGNFLYFGMYFFGYSAGWNTGYCIIGTFIFSGYIIYDTNQILKHLGPDDYIIAAIELYLDLINLFLLILRLLGGRK